MKTKTKKNELTINGPITNKSLIPTKAYEENEDIFKDMPEWEGERYRGVGAKRMKGYKCLIPINELNRLRDEFWTSKIKTDSIWKTIRHACIMDECNIILYLTFIVRGVSLLNSLGIQTVEGCINHLKDKSGNIYRIPNFCINDPYFEKHISEEDDNGRVAKLIDIT
jgi:hypothetical protein